MRAGGRGSISNRCHFSTGPEERKGPKKTQKKVRKSVGFAPALGRYVVTADNQQFCRLKEMVHMISNRIRRFPTSRMVVSSLFVAGLALNGAAAHAQGRTCSNAVLQGAYGGSVGMIALPAAGAPVGSGTPRAALLRFSFDGKGNFTNTVTLNDDGTVVKLADFGTYTVNADCTGILHTNGGTRTVDIVVVDSGNEFYSIRTDPANLVFIFNAAKKIFPGNNDSQDR